MGDLREIRLESDMNTELDFFFDNMAPFIYLANLQIEGFAKRQRRYRYLHRYSVRDGAKGDR